MKLGGLLAYYAGLAEDRSRSASQARGPVDYYLDPDEPAGRWWGRGRPALDLNGEVEGDELRALLDGRHPVTAEALGRAFGDSSARGFDATFSAPKSVSALWALTPDPFVRAEVLAAHDAAVDAALGWFEAHGAVTRRGRDGIHQVDTDGITVALFRQHTSRTVDPQLHTHAVIAAKVQDPTGRWLSLDARFLKQQQRTIGWIYDAALRGELTERLGVTWDRSDDLAYDLACVPEVVREVLSQRSAQVKAKHHELIGRWSAEHDGALPDRLTIAKLERAAAVSSRPAKQHDIAGTALHQLWEAQARAVGFDPGGLTADPIDQRPEPSAMTDAALVDEALRRVAEETSTWLRADVARHLAVLVPVGAGAPGADVVARIDRLAERAVERCVDLVPERPGGPVRRSDGRPVAEHLTDRRFTTDAVVDEETRLQTWAEANAGPVTPSAADPQTAAADAIAGAAPLVVVVGPAGTGKTTMTARAVSALRAEARPVVGLAPSGKAADVLTTEAGCPTATLASFLGQHRTGRPTRWPAGTTVILDEAGMAHTADLAELVHLVEANRWRLVAVGDPSQLPAVGRGGVFAHWCATIPHHELIRPRRFDQPWEAEASLALRTGEAEAADRYAEHGRLHATHPALVSSELATVHQAHSRAGRSVAITANTAETARSINVEIQRRLDPGGRRPGVRLADGTRACVGDQIATRRNDPGFRTDIGDQVRNRHTWTVIDVDDQARVVAAHPDRGTVALTAAYVAEHVELGWAVTGYGNQGDTVDIGLTVLEPGTTRNHAYVALTRGRAANHAWFPDPAGTEDPTDQLAAKIAHPADHLSALAVHAQLHREAGLPVPELTPTTRLSAESPALVRPPAPAADPTRGPTASERVHAIRERLDRLERHSLGRGLGR